MGSGIMVVRDGSGGRSSDLFGGEESPDSTGQDAPESGAFPAEKSGGGKVPQKRYRPDTLSG